VRGVDLADMSFVMGDTGWITFGPLTSGEAARAAFELVEKRLGKLPVTGVDFFSLLR
jgi:alkyl sulfatase BDS1-like metallo-beta-lactamase superfamily hydrolase